MSQESHKNKLDLDKQKIFYPYQYMTGFWKVLKKNYQAKKSFIAC